MKWQERDDREKARLVLVGEKMPKIAALLGWECQRDPRDKTFFLSNPPHAIHTYYDAWKDRLVFSGRYPRAMSQHVVTSGFNQDPSVQITVNPDRATSTIAKDIQSRLIPVYMDLWQALAEREREWSKRMAAKDDLGARIVHAGRGELIPDQDDTYRRVVARFGGKYDQPSGKAEISDLGTLHVKMELRNVPPELAEYIAGLFGEWAED